MGFAAYILQWVFFILGIIFMSLFIFSIIVKPVFFVSKRTALISYGIFTAIYLSLWYAEFDLYYKIQNLNTRISYYLSSKNESIDHKTSSTYKTQSTENTSDNNTSRTESDKQNQQMNNVNSQSIDTNNAVQEANTNTNNIAPPSYLPSNGAQIPNMSNNRENKRSTNTSSENKKNFPDRSDVRNKK